MESLQQATDGDGQRRNAQRYQESNITPRRYIEDETGTGNRTKRLVRGSLSLSGRSFIEQIQTNPLRGKISSSCARNFSSLCISTVKSHTASIQASRTTQSVRGTYRYDLLHCTFTRSLVSCLYFFFSLRVLSHLQIICLENTNEKLTCCIFPMVDFVLTLQCDKTDYLCLFLISTFIAASEHSLCSASFCC